MGFRPPKGVRPPQLEGKRTGRPKGTENFASAWQDAVWGLDHYDDENAIPPNPSARLWQSFAGWYPNELMDWLEANNML
jgi:hypothetical protein